MVWLEAGESRKTTLSETRYAWPWTLIRVYVTPNAREARVVKVSEDYLEVRVHERAVGGRANKRLLEILAEHSLGPARLTIRRVRS